MKLSKYLIGLFITSLLVLLPSKINAFQVEDNKVVYSDKVWRIEFNNEVVLDDITKKSIEILNKNGTKINVELALENNKSILVYPPNGGYDVGEYTLLIKNIIHSKKDLKLKKEIKMNFIIKADILEIKPYKDTVGYQGTNYILPETVVAVFKDGTTKNVPVKWECEYIDGSKVGEFVYYGTVEGCDKKAQLNVNIKPMQDIYDLEDYLNKCFSSVDTPVGKINLKYKIKENTVDFTPYDIWIQTDWEGVNLVELQHSIKISNEDKQKTMQVLKDLQKTIAEDVLRYFPNKKVKGGFYTYGYEYPYIHEGYWSISFLTWTNYNHNEMLDNYKNTHITEFHWFDLYDNYKF